MNRAIELFPCSGGMAEGFRRAGVVFDMAFDKDPDAIDSYEANHGHRPIQMDVCDLLRMVRAGWRPAETIALIVADPPCTPWSRAGKRQGVDDERDMLVETCELIGLLRPRTYLIGNVPGLNDGPQWKHVQEHIGGLQRHGYCVADYAELDAADYGVPQHRIRPFWFGHMGGGCLRWPEPTHGDPSKSMGLPGMALKPWVTCREALGHLPADQLGRPVRLRWKQTDDHRPSASSEPAKTITKNTHSDGCLLVNGRHQPAEPDQPAPTLGAKVRGQGAQVLRGPNGKPRAMGLRTSSPNSPCDTITTKTDRIGSGAGHTLDWPWARPATTIARDERIPPYGHHDSNSYLSDANAIVLSELAAKILQGFPETWHFAGKTKKARWSQLGQAMPPGLAEPVARAIVDQMRASAVTTEAA